MVAETHNFDLEKHATLELFPEEEGMLLRYSPVGADLITVDSCFGYRGRRDVQLWIYLSERSGEWYFDTSKIL